MRCCSDSSSLAPADVLPISVSEIQEAVENVDLADGCCASGLLGAAQPSCGSATDGRAGHKRELELADIFRQFGPAYRDDHRLSSEQLKVMYAIEHCRTAAYGLHVDVCDSCGHSQSAYNSCRNRHCPKCQGTARRKWVNARLDELLPVAYHHVVFTLPNQLSMLSLHNQRLIYDLLFEAASQTLLCFGQDPKWLGAQIGFFGILHTWSQTLWPHPHLHLIVTAGGLNDAGQWIEPRYNHRFLFPVKALSKVFRGKFIQGLKNAYNAGTLVVNDDIADAASFECWVDRLVSRNWVVYSKPPFGGPDEVVRYIGRYSHRVAISNYRLFSIRNGQVCFNYKDNREKDKTRRWKQMTLPADQFITRFLWHVLPSGYHRIRHFGFLNNGQKHANLVRIRAELDSVSDSTQFATDEPGAMVCPECQSGRMRALLITDRDGRIVTCDISVLQAPPYNDSS